MKTVGAKTNILKMSGKLKSSLEIAGRKEHYPGGHVLFSEDGKGAGVFLVCKGKVRMSVRAEAGQRFRRGLVAGTAGHFHRTSL